MSQHPYKGSKFHQLLNRYRTSNKLPASKSDCSHRWTRQLLAESISAGPDDFERSFAALSTWLSGKHIPESAERAERLADSFFDKEPATKTERALRLEFLESLDDARARRQEERAKAFFVSPIPDEETLRRVWGFDQSAYGTLAKDEPNNITFDLFEKWRRAYHHALIGAYTSTNRDEVDFVEPHTLTSEEKESVFAVIGILPIKKRWSEQFILRRVRERRLYPRDFEGSGSKYWYLSGISSKPEHLKAVKRVLFIKHFLRKSSSYWRETCGLDDKATVHFVAEGSTDEGSNLLNSVAIKKVSDPTHRHERPLHRGIVTVGEFMDRLARGAYSRVR